VETEPSGAFGYPADRLATRGLFGLDDSKRLFVSGGGGCGAGNEGTDWAFDKNRWAALGQSS
jgi:hypothetical protein